jgi:predicted nucleic acid-binding protein
MSVVLCDAGPLMALGKLNRLDLLAGLFGQVQIPRAVYDEVVTQGLA